MKSSCNINRFTNSRIRSTKRREDTPHSNKKVIYKAVKTKRKTKRNKNYLGFAKAKTRQQKQGTKPCVERKMASPVLSCPQRAHTQIQTHKHQNCKIGITAVDRKTAVVAWTIISSVSKLRESFKGAHRAAVLRPPLVRRYPLRARLDTTDRGARLSLSEAYQAKLRCRLHLPPSSAPPPASPAAAAGPGQAPCSPWCGELQLRSAAQSRGWAW